MAHTIHGKKNLLVRIKRIKGQVNGIEKVIEEEGDCSDLLQAVASCRGALNGLMGELIEGHVMEHVIDPHAKTSVEQKRAAEQLLNVVKAYFK
jgi:DNA-binding FrmR family transcriptional regulator